MYSVENGSKSMVEKVRTHLMTVKFKIHLENSDNFGIRRANQITWREEKNGKSRKRSAPGAQSSSEIH